MPTSSNEDSNDSLPSVGSFNDLNLKARGSQSKASTSKEFLNEALSKESHTSHKRAFADIQNKPFSFRSLDEVTLGRLSFESSFESVEALSCSIPM